MDMFRVLFKRCSALFGGSKLDGNLDEELVAHIDLAVEENMRAGMSREEARTAALRSFGGVTQTKEAYRVQRGLPLGETLLRDVHVALRQLRRNPGFTLAVILTLALAIGANTAIFSIVNALMLKSLPYAHPERMGTIFTRITGKNTTDERHHINGEQWELLRDSVPALISAASGIRASGVNLQSGPHVEYVHDARVFEPRHDGADDSCLAEATEARRRLLRLTSGRSLGSVGAGVADGERCVVGERLRHLPIRLVERW